MCHMIRKIFLYSVTLHVEKMEFSDAVYSSHLKRFPTFEHDLLQNAHPIALLSRIFLRNFFFKLILYRFYSMGILCSV